MTRSGVDRETGRYIFGWEHCLQSIVTILTTELGERVQLRDFGSDVPSLIDRPQTPETIIDFYVAAAQALEPRIVEGRQLGEPGFILLRANVDAGTPGRVTMQLAGVFFENGHLGNFSNPVERAAILSLREVEGRVLIGIV